MSDTSDNPTIEEQLAAAPDLTAEIPHPADARAEAPATRAMGTALFELYHGMNHLFGYGPVPGVNTGAQAIATILDFWNQDLGYARSVQGNGDANDGRLHFPPDYAVSVARQVATSGLFGAPIPNKEDMAGALQRFGFVAQIGHSAAFGDGNAEVATLRNWVSQYRLPVACLLDASQVSANGPLRWHVVCGWSDEHVLLADEGRVYQFTWQQFRDAWHCPGLPWPNNYVGIYAFRPDKG